MGRNGIIFDIKQFAVHDGPGIRTTVFLKGCPLQCDWCHNPEGISSSKEVIYYPQKCIACKECIRTCSHNAVTTSKNGKIVSLRERCVACGECVNVCPSEARQIVGREVSVKEIMEEIRKSFIYYDTSGGGVTFSGGEPLAQPYFLKTLLQECKEVGIHTCIDTSGFAPQKLFQSVIPFVDLFLYDLKFVNENTHQQYCGVSNSLIKKNLTTLVQKGRGNDVIIRFPVIPGVTDTNENVAALSRFLASLDGVKELDLLPFHHVNEKYQRLGREYEMQDVAQPSITRLKNLKEEFKTKNKQLSRK